NKAALKKIKSLSEHDDGNSLSNLLWWIFSKGDCKHSQPHQLRKQQKEMLPKVWRGKWGPLVTESGESDGWEEGYGGVMVMEEVEWKMKKRLNH
ncbi:hypothetical protein Tco_0244988, partial [Tanacetum coccineum]